MTDTVDLLAGVPLLATLDRRHLERLAKDFTERTFPAGSVVIREGDDSRRSKRCPASTGSSSSSITSTGHRSRAYDAVSTTSWPRVLGKADRRE